MSDTDVVDAVVIGAGPAGLTAALYLARYHRNVLVLHDGHSRALRIPLTHNVPGFPDGVNGQDLIARMTSHAEHYGARIVKSKVTALRRTQEGFRLETENGPRHARAVILATGIFLNEIDLPRDVHEQAIKDGVLRYCPICDAHEHSDMNIGVIGCDTNGAAEAMFLRQYSDRITLMPLSHPELTPSEKVQLETASISFVPGALTALTPHSDRFEVTLEDGEVHAFDVVYPALGCSPRSELGASLGLELTDQGCLPTKAVTDSGIDGFWAAGDVVDGLDQISVAMGHGALAATKLHNWLREIDQEALQSA